jgi:Uma2 family endonuclease
MATTPTRLMTLAEYEQVPDPLEGAWELYHGELVKVGYPKISHTKGRRQIYRLLEPWVGESGVVMIEMPFCPLPEYECWAADVAFVTKQRWDTATDWLAGAPELVVEIVSPSNSAPKLLDKAQLCLSNGCREFWIVNLRKRQVRVLTGPKDIVYDLGQRIPLFFGGEIAVEDIFR